MSGFTTNILNSTRSGLSVQQALLAVTANNISNVNTEGYSRQRANLEARITRGEATSLNVGQGVEVGKIERVHDRFLERVMQIANSEKGTAVTVNEFLTRAEQIYALTGEQSSVGSALEEFFGAISDLTINPSSPDLKANLVERGKTLTSLINSSYTYLADLQSEADNRLVTEIDSVNELSRKIASLNGEIVNQESLGQEASAQRDERDLAIKELSEKLTVEVIEQSDGQVLVTLKNGFNLVNNTTATKLETTKSPSFITGSIPQSLSNETLNYIVFNHSDDPNNPQHTNLTNVIASEQGVVSGLLNVRGVHEDTDTSPFQAKGDIVELASYFEGISRALLTEFNQVYLGVNPENLASVGGNPLLNDENNLTTAYDPSSGTFNESGLISNPSSLFGFFDFEGAADTGSGSYAGLPDSADLNNLQSSFGNYASRIRVAINDPSELATGVDLNTAPNALNIQPGDISNLQNLLELREKKFSLTIGSYSSEGSLSEIYRLGVNRIGNLARSAESQVKIAETNLLFAEEQHNTYSGVSLDEEFTNLVKFQRAFQASARLMRVADELLQEIVNLI
jgi:flagellar hook-associated protein 1